jgi:hypothetical protein
MNQAAYLLRAKELEKEFLPTRSIILRKENDVYVVDGQRFTETEFKNWRTALPHNVQLIVIFSDELVTL